MSLLKQANHALRNGQYETAIRLYQQSLQDSPALAHIIQPNLKLAQSRHQKTGTAARQPSLPALPPKSSIDFAAMRVEDIISGAEQAMARDDWHSAYEHWNSLLTRPDEELSPQLLLRTSRELFKLDAFPQAAAALQRAATRNPQDPDVIREQAHQYYYHCYSSWLMLVTENEPDWYKADGLDKRPDWKTACELLEKAEKVSPRHNLRRYVQAYLLLAEDAWDKQNRTQAHAALDTALKAIGPNKLDQTLVQAIHTAVDQFRDGQVPENDPYYQTLQDQLKAMPLELLDVKNWLCLNDILNWNGLLLCGYVAREKAVDLALEQGKKENANKEALKTALKAALDRNDTKLADTYLGKLKRISPDAIDVRELDSCTELMKGNLDAFRQKWPHPPTPAEQRLRDYLKGKTVAVVGPAPTGTLDGEEIDRHDVVVRMNWRGQDSMLDAREFGSKTNISLYNAHTVRLLTADKRLEQTKSLDFRLIRRARHDAHQLQMIAEYPGAFYKTLNAVPVVLFNIFLCEPKEVKLFKTTFYLGEKLHAKNYRNHEDFDILSLKKIQIVIANHDLKHQVKFVYQLKKNNFIKIKNINFSKYLYILESQLIEATKKANKVKIGILHQYFTQEKVANEIIGDLKKGENNSVCFNLGFVENNISDDEYIKSLFYFDVLIILIGGRQLQNLCLRIRDIMRQKMIKKRPVLMSLPVGVTLDSVYYGAFGYREICDVVFVPRKSDFKKISGFYNAIGSKTKVEICRCPIFNEFEYKLLDNSSEKIKINSLLFVVQTDIPKSKKEREYIAGQLFHYAKKFKNRKLIIKPKIKPGENFAHPQIFPYEDIFKEKKYISDNIEFNYGGIVDLIKSVDAVISISSTAILEACLLSKPCAIITDLGIAERYGNTYFAESGMLRSFDDIFNDRISFAKFDWIRKEVGAPLLSEVFYAITEGGKLDIMKSTPIHSSVCNLTYSE